MWSSNQSPLTSSELLVNTFGYWFSSWLWPDNLEDYLPSDIKSFDHPIKANQLEVNLLKVYLPLDYCVWINFEVCQAILKVFPRMYPFAFVDFRFQDRMTALWMSNCLKIPAISSWLAPIKTQIGLIRTKAEGYILWTPFDYPLLVFIGSYLLWSRRR